MTGPIAAFDHAMIATQDLERAAKTYRSLGFRVTPRGVHTGRGTANYCIMFSEGYLELIGVIDPATASGRPSQHIAASGEGPIGLAWGAPDADAAYKALIAAGIEAEPPVELARPLELDTGPEMVRFRNVMLPKAGLDPILQFVCTHLTPQLTRARHEWQLHANGATGVNEIIVAVSDPASHLEVFQALFGRKAVRERAGHVTALVEPMTLRLTSWASIAERFPRVQMKPSAAPQLAAICLDVTEPDAATTMWDMASIPYHHGRGGAVYLGPEHTHGVILELSEG